MKKFIAIILTFCLILCAFPLQAMAYPGDIWRPGKDGGEVKTMKLKNGALALQNDYLRVTLQKTQYGFKSTREIFESLKFGLDIQTHLWYVVVLEKEA